MGQKIHPIGFRIGINEEWRSRWYARKADYKHLLVEDFQLRKFIKDRYHKAMIPRIDIQRQGKKLDIIVHTGRPGIIIGKKGSEVDRLRSLLSDLVDKETELNLDVQEVPEVDLEAQLVAENVADQLSRRIAFRRAIKRCSEQVMQKGARGVKIMISGRLGGSDMARCEVSQHGSIPLQKLDAKIDYGFTEARTPYGYIGTKVWIYRGDYSIAERVKGKKREAAARGRDDRGGSEPRRPRRSAVAEHKSARGPKSDGGAS